MSIVAKQRLESKNYFINNTIGFFIPKENCDNMVFASYLFLTSNVNGASSNEELILLLINHCEKYIEDQWINEDCFIDLIIVTWNCLKIQNKDGLPSRKWLFTTENNFFNIILKTLESEITNNKRNSIILNNILS